MKYYVTFYCCICSRRSSEKFFATKKDKVEVHTKQICTRIGEEQMRKKFVRSLAGVLTAVLVFSSGSVPVYGAQEKALLNSLRVSAETEAVKKERDVKTVTDAAVTLVADREGTTLIRGSLEVMVTAGVEAKSVQEFVVTLEEKNTSGSGGTKQLVLPETSRTEVSRGSVRFPELEKGTYLVSVSAPGYITYQQEVEVDSCLAYRIQLYTGKVNFEGRQPGLLKKGDMNGDGKLDKEDADAIIDQIDSAKYDSIYDLNGDGKVDLLDLNYFTDFWLNYEVQLADVEKLLPIEAIVSEVSEETEIRNGSLEQVLTGEGEVSLGLTTNDMITEDTPVEVNFDFSRSEEPMMMEGLVVKTPRNSDGTSADGAIVAGAVTIVYEDENGQQITIEESIPDSSTTQSVRVVKGGGAVAEWQNNGELCINLQGMVAVKLVTLRITKTANTKNLAKISSVEFLNDMESRIPEPEMNIPTNLQGNPGNKQFQLTWDRQKNVTAYEVEVSCEGITEYKKVTSNSTLIAQFNKDKMVNGKEYTVRVQSLNGEWKSGFSDSISVVPKPNSVPKAPDGVTVVGGYQSLDVRWKELEDTDSYNVFYKKESESEFKKVTGITACYYQITGLESDTKYQVYLTASNELGEGPKSLTAADKTLSGLEEAKLPEYKLINTSNGKGKLSSHIKSASINSAGQMIDSPLDASGTNSALGVFDNDYVSYMYREDWDYGGAYPSIDKGITTEFDQSYSIGMITFAEPIDLGAYSYVSVFYWDANGTRKKAENVTIHTRKTDNRNYYLIKFRDPIVTSKIQFGVGRYNAGIRKITISEVRFYEYDSLEQDIMNLYEDSLHIVLKKEVTAQTIQELQNRLNTVDPVSKEYHPEKESLQKELDMAKQLLETGGLGGVLQVNPMITAANDSQISVGGMNAWQPLGVSAAAGEEIVVYVGKPGAANGANSNVRLVVTQQHAESTNLSTTMNLKIGRNEITLPKISTTDVEKGGALYIEYTGNNANDQYAVRVSGGTTFPVLNVYRVSEEERIKRIQTYIEELSAYVEQIREKHGEVHSGSQNENVQYSYDRKTCILNTTDIVMDKMMLSIPASQVFDALGEGNKEERMETAIRAMDEMLTLFYQHKGLTDSFAEGTDAAVIAKNHIPYRYLNIRYMKMFAGAFMYAAGNHIGIEWGSTPGMISATPATYDENGKGTGGKYFGWGIAHEIGHDINQGAYAHAEVTNNYFSVLAQAQDTNNSVRFQYDQVFKKVTSGTTGYANNVFTQLGMYWQLHLAYDRGYNYKTYDSYQEIFENIFFARVDSYARDAASAPAPNGIALTVDGDRDQNIMRLASAAAERDLTEFFIRWGMIPDEKTYSYAGQFPKETRAIYYVDDEARVYEIEHGTVGTIDGKSVVTAVAEAVNSTVTVQIDSNADTEIVQGYEITRVFVEQGEERREIAGFTRENTFIDQVPFAANRVITYEVTAVDKFMNRSELYQTNSVKIGGDGIQDKTHWSITTNMVSKEDQPVEGTEDLPCETTTSTKERMIDYDNLTAFTGTAEGEDPYVILELNQITEVAALQYNGQAIGAYTIEISTDGTTYHEVKKGTLDKTEEMLYFDNGKWICTYDAVFVKLTAVGRSGEEISISELNLYGPSGDNVEFLSAEGKAGIGVLESDYIYDETGKAIPAGSIVFTGSYKGNPAYNVVVLYDENGQIVGGTDENGDLVAHQIVLAPELGDKALLGETSEGIWIYWFEPSTNVSAESLPSKVRAELYRVDNALTNEGQRLVSDTIFEVIPETLPSITLTK